MTQPATKPALPALNLDYSTGMFTNTLTGETGPDVTGVVLAYRTDRILWPSPQNPDPRPECENGTVYGPCHECQFAAFGRNGEPPVCSEELTLLLWQDDGAQVVTVTGRRSYLKPLEQFLDMKALVTGTLHDQRVTIRMTPGPDLHRLTLLPGDMLDPDSVGRMAGVAERVQRSGAWGGL
jgi:hypothetical protein